MQIAQSTRDCVTLGWWKIFACYATRTYFQDSYFFCNITMLKIEIEMSSLKAPSHDEVCKENKVVSARFEPFEALRFTAYQSFANISDQMVKTHFLWQCRMNSYPLVPIVSMRKVQVWKSHDCPFFPFPQPDQSPPEIVPFLPAGTWVRRSKHEGWSVGALA